MILESLIQFLSTALAFTLLLTLFSAFIFYGRYKTNNSRLNIFASTVHVPLTSSVEVAQVSLPRQAAVRRRLHFAPAKEV